MPLGRMLNACDQRAVRLTRRGCAHFSSGWEVRLRGAGAQEEREPRVPPASCESPPPPLGRAARVRVSDAFYLPPNCYCDRQGIGCHPRGVHLYPAGASPSRKRWTQTLHRQHSCLPGQAKNETAAMLSQSKFFHRMWTNLFAVAGTGEHPMAGVIRKRGQGHLLCACRAQRHRPRRPQAAKSLPA